MLVTVTANGLTGSGNNICAARRRQLDRGRPLRRPHPGIGISQATFYSARSNANAESYALHVPQRQPVLRAAPSCLPTATALAVRYTGVNPSRRSTRTRPANQVYSRPRPETERGLPAIRVAPDTPATRSSALYGTAASSFTGSSPQAGSRGFDRVGHVDRRDRLLRGQPRFVVDHDDPFVSPRRREQGLDRADRRPAGRLRGLHVLELRVRHGGLRAHRLRAQAIKAAEDALVGPDLLETARPRQKVIILLSDGDANT